MHNSQNPILATLAYHDIFDWPLTAWEVHRFQLKSEISNSQFLISNYADVLEELERLKGEGIITERNGFYMLKGREGLYEERIERTKLAEEKWHKALPALRFLRAVPFVRCLALSGSIAAGRVTPESDIDLLVIAEKNRIWTARLLFTVFAILTGRMRPSRLTRFFFPLVRYGTRRSFADKLCPNHYLTVSSLALPPEVQNLYNAAIYVHLVPLWGAAYLDKFYEENDWIRSYFPNSVLSSHNLKTMFPERSHASGNIGKSDFPITAMRKSDFLAMIPAWIKKFLELPLRGRLGDVPEKLLGTFQKALIRLNPQSRKGRVVAGGMELAFHAETPEKEVLDRFRQKMLELKADMLW